MPLPEFHLNSGLVCVTHLCKSVTRVLLLFRDSGHILEVYPCSKYLPSVCMQITYKYILLKGICYHFFVQSRNFYCGQTSLLSSPEFTLTQEALTRLVPPDGKGCRYSEYLAVSGGRERQVFGNIAGRQEVDKEDESENNRMCIFRVACLEVEEQTDSLCLSLKGFLNGDNRWALHFLSDDP